MQTKLKICSICGRSAKLWKSKPPIGICCARKQASKAAIEKAGEHKQVTLTQTENGKVAKVFKYQTKNHKRTKSLTVEQINKKAEINEFFDSQALQVPERCENCNLRLNAYAAWQKRFVTAHICPKNDKEFPTVATHPENRMFLGSGLFSDCSCHDLWDGRDAEARKKMHCYDLALSRAEKFYNALTPHEQNKFDKYFGLEVKIVD